MFLKSIYSQKFATILLLLYIYMNLFKIKNSEILRYVNSSSNIVERKQTLPILANLLFIIEDNTLTIKGFDQEIQIVCQLKIKSDQQTRFTVPARKLNDILRNLSENIDVSFSLIDGKVILKCSNSQFTLLTIDANEFPQLLDEENEDTHVIKLEKLKIKNILQHVIFSMASQDIRFYLNGLLLKVEQNNIFFVSTDGHRLSFYNVVDNENKQTFSVIIPRKAILEIYKNLDISETKFIEIKYSKKFISFINANIEIKSKIIEGNFPDYTKVIPQENPIKIEIEREKLLKTLQRVSVLSNDKIRGIRLTFNDNKLIVVCSNQDRESAEETIDVNYTFESLEIGFNVNYLLDSLSNINDEKIIISLRDQNSSMLIEKKDNQHFKYVVMPMRI